ncbi:MAG: amidohydrolase family protein [Pseudomonadota bacterium]
MVQNTAGGSSRRIVLLCFLLLTGSSGGCGSTSTVAPSRPAPERAAAGTGSATVIYPARAVVTLNRAAPAAEAVAIRRTRIAGVGSLSELRDRFPEARLDRRFRDLVIVPGLIDPHMHVLLGAMLYAQPFAAPWPMATGAGMTPGYPDRSAFRKRLREIVAQAPDDDSPIFCYGYHNLLQGQLNRRDLDAISPERPLLVWHYSAHDFYLNSAALNLIGATPGWAGRMDGVAVDDTGALTGRLYETAANQVITRLSEQLLDPVALAGGLARYFGILRAAGVTTTADLAWGAFDFERESQLIRGNWNRKRTGFQLYLIPEFRALQRIYGEDAAATVQAWADGTEKTPAPVLPRVKFFADGAYYSQTMRLDPPGYLSGQSQGTEGVWVVPPGILRDTVRPYTDAGLAAHIHSNGDAAQTASLDTLAQLRSAGFEGDFVIEHGALFSPAQRQRAAELNAMVSVASHYVHHLAEALREPLGRTRSQWISPVGGLTRAGTVVALHSDAPLAPPVPLLAAARHVTRETISGNRYATAQALTLYEALEAITLDAARVLGLADEIGSIEEGKRADLTVLSRNPLRTAADRWPDIEVWGVMLRGKPRPLPSAGEQPLRRVQR